MSGYWPEGDLGDDCDGDLNGYDGGYADCLCERYVVDYSDPERYHPENIDRELNSDCPVHGATP